MKGIIVYYSDYGSTREYMEELAKRLDWPVYSMKEAKKISLEDAETVVLASNVIAGQMKVGKWAKKHQAVLKGKTILAVPVGAAQEDDKEQYMKNVTQSLDFLAIPEERIFPLRGRKIFSEMRGFHRFMMNTVTKMIKDPEIKEQMLTEITEINLESLTKILDYVKKS